MVCSVFGSLVRTVIFGDGIPFILLVLGDKRSSVLYIGVGSKQNNGASNNSKSIRQTKEVSRNGV